MFSTETVIGVAGAGAMGAGIAQVAAAAGHRVIALDRDDAALARGRVVVKKGVDALLKRGKLDADGGAALKERILWTTSADDLAPAGLVIEAIVENADIKGALFKQLEGILAPEAVIATNTSSLSVAALAAGLERPERFIGLHFFNPAPVMKLVEVIAGPASAPALVGAAFDLMKRWGKEAARAKDVPGFIVNRVARPFYGEGWRALEEGAGDAATIDFLFRELGGFRMGPMELGDFIGHDINFTAAKSVFDAYFGRTRFAPSLMQGQLVAAGRLGRKTGSGVYDHADGAEKAAPTLLAPPRDRISIRMGRDSERLAAFLPRESQGDIDSDLPSGFACVGETLIGFAGGWTAGMLAGDWARGGPVAVLDWVSDPERASVLAFAASDENARAAALAFAGAGGRKAVELADRPGLVVLRTLLQLANCAGDALRDRVASEDDIDCAMLYGVNYPVGPLAWARGYGVPRVITALEQIARWTGDPIYAPSEGLRSLAL